MERTKLLTILVGISLVLAMVNIYAIVNLYSKLDDSDRTAPEQQENADDEKETTRIKVSADDDPAKGLKNAPVTIIEFSDFQCPYCARFFEQTLPLLEKNYIATGKARIVYRDFPLGFHENAEKAAEAAECADEQGKFWEYHDKIFENQDAIGVSNLKQYAETLGLNMEKFNGCLDSGKMASEVKEDLKDGTKYGVTGTPSFFINGINIVGAQPYSVFEQIIKQEIEK